jgi:hypothetical protein
MIRWKKVVLPTVVEFEIKIVEHGLAVGIAEIDIF